ncbi:MAG: P-loop NTPase [Nitrospirae bacterium]|nr:P-loop NTPase [Nitrospirota bacterium]
MKDNVTHKNKKCEVWAVGSGKGGTGKSFITSSIGIHLASKGKKIVLVDADFGAANLHTFVGVGKPQNSLTDFFEKKTPLKDLVVNCGVSDLGLVAGSMRSFEAENIKSQQKVKFFKHINQIETDIILIDLGAGSHFNTMDTFLLADKMIVVVAPELTAIENLYQFIKSAFFRKLRLVLDAHGLKTTFQETWKDREARGIKSLKDLIEYLICVSPQVRDIISREMSDFNLHIVVNQMRNGQDVFIGSSVKSICMKFLGFNARYSGSVEYDESVTRCINRKQPFMVTYPSSPVARAIGKLSENLLEGKEIIIGKNGSAY